jgi:hypothetical protein
MGNDQAITRDVVGIFFGSERLQGAINNLTMEGIDSTRIGILCSEETTREKLSHVYGEVAVEDGSGNPDNQCRFEIKSDSVATAPYATIGGLSLVATALGGGAIVASAGVLGGALVVATAASTVAAGLGAVAGAAISESEKNTIQHELDKGHILLWVRVKESKEKERAMHILHESSELEPIVLEAKTAEAA